MLTLHHLEYSQSYRVLWLLEELGSDYELIVYQRDKKTQLAPDNYKAISPLGTAPVITDGELQLSETAAIFDYLLDQHPKSALQPQAGSAQRANYLFWYHAAQGSMMPLMLLDTVFRIVEKRSPFFIKPLMKGISKQINAAMVHPRMKLILNRAEQDLGVTGWFSGGDLSAADMMMSYPMESAHARGIIDNKYPNCVAWLERIKLSESYQSAKQKDGQPSSVFPI